MPPDARPRLRFTARAPRGPVGRAVKWSFWIFQAVMAALALGNCTLVLPFLGNADPEVAIGAGMFAAWLGLGVFALWPLGTLVLGLALWFTRGKVLVLEADAPTSRPEA